MLFVLVLLPVLCSVSGHDTNRQLPRVCPDVVKRSEWGAANSTQVAYTVLPVEIVIIHHTVTSSCNSEDKCGKLLRNIQNNHMNERNFDDIAYNFLIGGDGEAYEGRGWHQIGSHTRAYNSKSLGIAFLGNFSRRLPTDDQLQTARDLIKCGVELGELSPVYRLYGARQLSTTQSPGQRLFNEITNWDHFSTI